MVLFIAVLVSCEANAAVYGLTIVGKRLAWMTPGSQSLGVTVQSRFSIRFYCR